MDKCLQDMHNRAVLMTAQTRQREAALQRESAELRWAMEKTDADELASLQGKHGAGAGICEGIVAGPVGKGSFANPGQQ